MKESFLPSKTFPDKKQTMFLSITPHFLQHGNAMMRDYFFGFDRSNKERYGTSIITQDHFKNYDAAGRFLTPDKIVIEQGELNEKEMKYLKRIARVVCRK